jgi:hypothetical protein
MAKQSEGCNRHTHHVCARYDGLRLPSHTGAVSRFELLTSGSRASAAAAAQPPSAQPSAAMLPAGCRKHNRHAGQQSTRVSTRHSSAKPLAERQFQPVSAPQHRQQQACREHHAHCSVATKRTVRDSPKAHIAGTLPKPLAPALALSPIHSVSTNTHTHTAAD